MENLKIRVNSEAESKEVQGLLEKLGFKKSVWGTYSDYFIFANSNYYSRDDISNFSECDYKEITLPKLRDMVVLKRNDVGDANAFRHDNDVKYYITSDNKYYYFSDIPTFQWTESCNDIDYLEKHVKPIEKPMKEYLRKNNDGEYILGVTDEREAQEPHAKHWIEIPEGADIAIKFKEDPDEFGIIFYKNNGKSCFSQNDKAWKNDADWTMKGLLNENYFEDGIDLSHDILWQRATHPEELPFIDDEPLQSLNDQYAEIEKVRQTLNQRQSQYGSFEDVATATQDLLKILEKTGLKSLPSMHKEALHMICSKMVRIVNGDHNFIESWHDIAGYATLMENELRATDGATNSRLTYQKVINGKLQDI